MHAGKAGPHVHHHRGAGAERALGLARRKAALPQQRPVGIAQHPADGDGAGEKAAEVALAERGVRVADPGQHPQRDIEQAAGLLAPAELLDVEQLGAGGVGVIGQMPPGELEQQPAVDGAADKVRVPARPRQVVQQPAHLGRRKIGGKGQPGDLLDAPTLAGDPPALLGRPAALPDDGVVGGQAGLFVPDQHRLPLVAEARARHRGRVHAALLQQLAHHGQRVLVNLHRVVLHPALLGDDLAVLAVAAAEKTARPAEQHRLGALGALVDGEQISFSHSATIFRAARQMPSASRP